MNKRFWWIMVGLQFVNWSSWQVNRNDLHGDSCWFVNGYICRHFLTNCFHSNKMFTKLQSKGGGESPSLGNTLASFKPVMLVARGLLLFSLFSLPIFLNSLQNPTSSCLGFRTLCFFEISSLRSDSVLLWDLKLVMLGALGSARHSAHRNSLLGLKILPLAWILCGSPLRLVLSDLQFHNSAGFYWELFTLNWVCWRSKPPSNTILCFISPVSLVSLLWCVSVLLHHEMNPFF